MTFRLLMFAILLTGFVFRPARAEIIIDDFDDPIQILLPEMENQSVMTIGVGVLGANRVIDVSSSQTDPIGHVDVAITRPSHLTAQIDGQFLDNPLNLPILSIGSGYDFGQPTDLTDAGLNDAIIIDMTIFQGSGIPPALSVLVRDANDVFAAIVSGFRLPSDSPYKLILPFSSFGFRGGGGVGLADFSTIDLLEVRVRLLQGGRDPYVNWFVQIDRIAVGRAVPEPELWRLTVMAALVMLTIDGQRRWGRISFLTK